jgi:hypothetical protein
VRSKGAFAPALNETLLPIAKATKDFCQDFKASDRMASEDMLRKCRKKWTTAIVTCKNENSFSFFYFK